MVFISAPVFDLLGTLQVRHLASNTGIEDATRRITRTATLDGSAMVYDGGYSAADRVLTVGISPFTAAQFDRVRRLVQTYPRLIVTMREGGFECASQAYTISQNTLNIRLLVLKDLTAI